MKLGILCSGSGTNLQAILDAVSSGSLKAEVKVVIANVSTAKALDRAKVFGTRTAFVDHKAFPSRDAFDAALVEILKAEEVDCVVLAGFMRLVTSTLLDAFPDRVINVHPALLPAFPGVNAQKQALDYGVRVTGCTVHFVDAGMDTGPIIAQSTIPVLDSDDEKSLRKRVLEQEHELLPLALQWIAEGRVTVERSSAYRPKVRVRS